MAWPRHRAHRRARIPAAWACAQNDQPARDGLRRELQRVLRRLVCPVCEHGGGRHVRGSRLQRVSPGARILRQFGSREGGERRRGCFRCVISLFSLGERLTSAFRYEKTPVPRSNQTVGASQWTRYARQCPRRLITRRMPKSIQTDCQCYKIVRVHYIIIYSTEAVPPPDVPTSPAPHHKISPAPPGRSKTYEDLA